MMRPTTRSSRSSRPVPIKIHCDNSEPVTADDSTDTPGTNTAKKHEKPEKGEKGKKPRHRMTNRQLEHLEALYQKATHPSRQDKEELGKKVGMDMRTVTVWFQNRRQLAKKADENAPRDALSVHPAIDGYRRALGVVDQAHQNIARPSSNHLDQATRKPNVILARKQVPESPDFGQSAYMTPSTSTPLLIRIGDPNEELPRKRQRSTKRMLDWVCSRVEKRARHDQDGKTEDDQGDTTDDEETSRSMNIDMDIDAADILTSLKGQPLKGISIPPEFSSHYDPDIVLGASLLLSFKYSAN